MKMFKNIKEYVIEKKENLKQMILKSNSKLKMIVVRVGDDPASVKYTNNKIKDCLELGITAELLKFSEDISEDELMRQLHYLNIDDTVTGYLVQLPLPKHINEERITRMIWPIKDIDGFHPESKTVAATPLGVYTYLKDMKYEFSGKNAVIIGRSHIVGRPMHKLLLDANMNVTILHTRTSEEDKRFYLEHADLIIVAAGKHGVLNRSYKLKETAVVMDVGINFDENGKLIGDCEKDLPVAFQSPVPGGCGLLTRLAVIENLVKLEEN